MVSVEQLPTAAVTDVPVVAAEATTRSTYTCLAAVPAGINADQRNMFVSNTVSYLATHKTVAEREAMQKHLDASMHEDYADDLYEYHMADTHTTHDQDYVSIETPNAVPDLNAAKCSLATLLVNLVYARVAVWLLARILPAVLLHQFPDTILPTSGSSLNVNRRA